jgi:hypothetical protein
MGNYMRRTVFLQQSEVKSGLGVRELERPTKLAFEPYHAQSHVCRSNSPPDFSVQMGNNHSAAALGYTPKTDGKAPRNGNKPMQPGVGIRTQTNPDPQPG